MALVFLIWIRSIFGAMQTRLHRLRDKLSYCFTHSVPFDSFKVFTTLFLWFLYFLLFADVLSFVLFYAICSGNRQQYRNVYVYHNHFAWPIQMVEGMASINWFELRWISRRIGVRHTGMYIQITNSKWEKIEKKKWMNEGVTLHLFKPLSHDSMMTCTY